MQVRSILHAASCSFCGEIIDLPAIQANEGELSLAYAEMHTPAQPFDCLTAVMASHTSELIVHDDAIRANTAVFAKLTEGKLMAVLKADAFGHGAIAESVLAAGASSIGVATIEEALALRSAGVDAPMLSWLNSVEADFAAAIVADVELAVSNYAVLAAISRAARAVSKRARLHLHVDLGLARDGCPLPDWRSLCTFAHEHELHGTVEVVGIMGHLSCADEPDHPQNAREELLFANAVRSAVRRGLRPRTRHVAATSATLGGIGSGFELHRIGAGLFGIDPSHSGTPLASALTLTTRVISSRPIDVNTCVGYGRDFVATADTHLALLPVGYGDGVPRCAAQRAEVFARGRRRPIVGRISMDMIVVDTGEDLLNPGEQVTVFGPGEAGEPTVTEWADWTGTIEHEIVTRLGSRVSRIHRRSDSVQSRR